MKVCHASAEYSLIWYILEALHASGMTWDICGLHESKAKVAPIEAVHRPIASSLTAHGCCIGPREVDAHDWILDSLIVVRFGLLIRQEVALDQIHGLPFDFEVSL